jgi:ATP-dependent RNA helicase RhlE
MSYQNNYRYRSNNRRQGGQSFGPGRRAKNGRSKQSIDPNRFIKAATAQASADYIPQNNFADFEMTDVLKRNVIALGFNQPSEIQDKTIALGLAGRNVVGIANTGTGKTAAFALPILNKLMHEPNSRALIIAPTRELAQQIDSQCRLLAKGSGLFASILIGGMPIGRQKQELRDNPNLVIGTPGRIKDHLDQRTLRLDRFSMVVLDEVDRMLDMGFLHDVRTILGLLPARHQAFFFSATMSPTISSLINTFTSDPITIDVKEGDTSANVHQNVVRVSGTSEKINSLHDLLIKPEVSKTLVFGKTKYSVERLARELKVRGFEADSIHGNKSQGQRKRAMDNFRESRVNVLVATDVAARGIDVKDISHVINYDVPQTYNDYIHRVGRAGRAGRPGYALTFVE